ncbi:MAG: Ig-like domain-containing protein [Cyclobacteriaceae bacterium]
MNLNKNLHWFIYIIFLLSCARQSSPTGGPKDTIPPVLERAIPPNEAINFNEKEIQLIFSENVILNAPKEQLIITPTIGKEYKIVNRKNSIILTFEDPLQDSTTYTFNFRESVQDITEKNPVRNLQLAYSTGTYIDSLSIEGTIYDMLKGKEIKDAAVALHVENDTFNILEHPAVYFTRTDEKGKFKISHLKPDNYYLYAFEDKNRNLVVNSRTESYGFRSEYQYLLENIKDISVGLVRLDAGPLKLTSARPYNTYFNIRTTKNLRTFQLTATDSTDITYTFGEDQANIRLYKTTDKDSLQIHLLAIDSIDNAIDTTLYAKFLSREVTPEPFEGRIQSASIFAHRGEMEATLLFTKPVKEINFDSLFFQLDSLTKVNFTKEDVTWHALSKQLTIRKKLDRALFETAEPNGQQRGGMRRAQPPKPEQPASEKKTPVVNEFVLATAAFISIENDSSKRLTQKVKPLNEQDLSIINIEIKTGEKSFIVELIDNSYKILRQIINKPKVRFEDLMPADYQIRLIIDSNQNGRWDPGNYHKNLEAEKIIYYRAADGSTIIKGVKANWDIGAGEMFITY